MKNKTCKEMAKQSYLKTKKNESQVVTVFIAQTKQYESALDRMIKKMERLSFLEKDYQELLKKRK